MSDFVRFKDSVNLVPLEIPKEVKDYYQQAAEDGLTNVKPLHVRIAATHSGKVTRNNGFYLPTKMRLGAHTFTSQYKKPIQVHHQDKEDPIGRVIQADYIDISVGITDSIKDSISDADKIEVQDFTEGKMSVNESVDFANKWIINDLKVSTDPDYEGLGYVEIVAQITDPSAIQKILDGRYLTGSVGATTNQAICSVCKQDWASKGKCEHKPGKIYDNAKCVIVAGELSYEEYSFVNKPADRHSRIIEVNTNGIQDFVVCEENKEFEVVTLVVDKHNHFKEEHNMIFKDALELAQQHDRFSNIETLVDDVKKLVDEHPDLDEEKLLALLDETYNSTQEDSKEEDFSAENENSNQKEEDSFSQSTLTEEKVSEMIADAVATALQSQEEKLNETKIMDQDLETKHAEETAKLQACLDAARKEIRYLHADISSLTDSLADSSSLVRKAHINHILDMQKLTGEDADLDAFAKLLNEKNTTDLELTLQDITAKVDMQKIIDNLNSGLTNSAPSGIVEDPTLTDDQDNKEKEIQLSDNQKKHLRLQWLQIRTSHGKDTADHWLKETCNAFEVDPTEVV